MGHRLKAGGEVRYRLRPGPYGGGGRKLALPEYRLQAEAAGELQPPEGVMGATPA